jgi:hypothetical protein
LATTADRSGIGRSPQVTSNRRKAQQTEALEAVRDEEQHGLNKGKTPRFLWITWSSLAV